MSALLVGYARCSTDQQDLTPQRDALLSLGVEAERIYVDHGLTGTNRASRPVGRWWCAGVGDGGKRWPTWSRWCIAARPAPSKSPSSSASAAPRSTAPSNGNASQRRPSWQKRRRDGDCPRVGVPHATPPWDADANRFVEYRETLSGFR